jgi:hypothetical protein
MDVPLVSFSPAWQATLASGVPHLFKARNGMKESQSIQNLRPPLSCNLPLDGYGDHYLIMLTNVLHGPALASLIKQSTSMGNFMVIYCDV